MKQTLCFMAVLMLALALPASALGDGNVYADIPREQAARLLSWLYPSYVVEDYIEILGTPKGDYCFALLTRGDERLLACHELWDISDPQGTVMQCFTSMSAAPQGDGDARFERHTVGADSEYDYQDEWGFNIRMGNRMASYHFSGGDFFRLDRFEDGGAMNGVCHVMDGPVIFYIDQGGGESGTVYVSMETDIRYVDYAALPKTLKAAQAAPDIPPGNSFYDPRWNTLLGVTLDLDGGRNHKVYSGPGEKYGRAGNGKATVSTNGWVQGFGVYNGFAMILYHIDGGRYRVGWIDEDLLPKRHGLPELRFTGDEQEIMSDCAMFDDPIGVNGEIIGLNAGTKVKVMACFGSAWEYVRVTVGGKTYWGFVPTDCLSHG